MTLAIFYPFSLTHSLLSSTHRSICYLVGFTCIGVSCDITMLVLTIHNLIACPHHVTFFQSMDPTTKKFPRRSSTLIVRIIWFHNIKHKWKYYILNGIIDNRDYWQKNWIISSIVTLSWFCLVDKEFCMHAW
jgi:hypothetical protein